MRNDAYRFARLTSTLAGLCVCLALESTSAGQVCPPSLQQYPTSTCDKNTEILRQGVTHQQSFRPQLTRCYQIQVEEPNQFVKVILDQHGLDVATTVYDPTPNAVAVIDGPTGSLGRESVSLVAHVPGTYTLVVSSSDTTTLSSSFEIKLVEQREATSDDEVFVKALWQLSSAELLTEEEGDPPHECALQQLKEALPVFSKFGDRHSEAETLNYVGNALIKLPRSREALEYLLPAIDMWPSLNDPLLYAAACNNTAVAHDNLGQGAEAVKYYEKALLLWDEVHNCRDKIGTLTNLGDLYYILGQSEKALKSFEDLLKLSCEERSAADEANILNFIGGVYIAKQDYQNASHYLLEALNKLRGTDKDYRKQQADIKNSLGAMYVLSGNYEKAFNTLDEALSLYTDVKYRRGRAAVFNGYGGAYLRRHKAGDIEKAIDQFNKSLGILDEMDAPFPTADTLFNLAKAQLESGRPLEAKLSMEEALNLLETLRENVKLTELRQSYFAQKHFYYDFYIKLLMSLHKDGMADGYDAEALLASERARSRTLLDLLIENERALGQELPQQVLTSIEQAQRKLADAYKFRRREGGDKLALANRALESTINENRNLALELGNRATALFFPLDSKSLEQIRSKLDDETIFIEFALGEKTSSIWVVSNQRLSSVAIPHGATEIGAIVQELIRSVTERSCRKTNETDQARQARIDKGDKTWPILAAQLSKILLEPIQDHLKVKRLVVIGDRKLQLLPFSVLPEPTNSDPNKLTLLIENHEVDYVPSIATLIEVQNSAIGHQRPPKAIAILADPVFDPDDERVRDRKSAQWPQNSSGFVAAQAARRLARGGNCLADDKRFDRLPGTYTEAIGIIKSLGPDMESRLAVNFDASLQTLMKDDLSQFRVLHLATHAYVPASAPEAASVILSLVDERGKKQPGYLGLAEIHQLKLNADLVTLSACETGIGKDVDGEGLVGLARGFMYAGTPRVVASLWKVEDVPTAKLMSGFYDSMFNGDLTAAAALRKAQLDMYKNAASQQKREPYYWAAFMFQGDFH